MPYNQQQPMPPRGAPDPAEAGWEQPHATQSPAGPGGQTAPPPQSGAGVQPGGQMDQDTARQVIMQAGEDLGPFMQDPELAAMLQEALRLLTASRGAGPAGPPAGAPQ